MTKLIIAGSRSINSAQTVLKALNESPWEMGETDRNVYEIIHGGADGVDSIASEFCDRFDHAEVVFEPDWNEHGKAAGPIRNAEMAKEGDALLAVWDGESSGTRSMVEKALDEGLDIYVYVE